jgi:hypothetical protein
MLMSMFNRDNWIERIYGNMVISFRILTVVFLSISLLSCVPSLFRSKIPDENQQTVATGSTLIKPKLAKSSETQNTGVSDKIQKSDGENLSPSDSKNQGFAPSRPQPDAGAGKNISPKTVEESSDKDIASKRLVGREKGKILPESEQISGVKPSDVKSKTPEDNEWDKPETSAPSFKKHNHQEYVTKITNLAIDEVNKELDVSYATICNDNTTDDWILTLYFKLDKTFSYKSFVWDSIDNKWDRDYESEKKPLIMWKKHLTFASSGKKCKALKGNSNN